MTVNLAAALLDAIQTAIANAPLVVITVGLLIGPTVVWIVWRLAFPRAKQPLLSSGRLLWVCPECRSVNESVQTRCYACHFEPLPSDDVAILDPVTGQPLTPLVGLPGFARPRPFVEPARPAVPVGPGRPVIASGRPSRSLMASEDPDSALLTTVGARRPFDTWAAMPPSSSPLPTPALPMPPSLSQPSPAPPAMPRAGEPPASPPATAPASPPIRRPASLVASGDRGTPGDRTSAPPEPGGAEG